MSDNVLKARKKLEDNIVPDKLTRIINDINPEISLGEKAGRDFQERSLTISSILIFSLLIAILSTILVFYIEEERNKNLIISVMSISWFVFLNFSFLIFEATKLFNILLFIALLTLIATAVSDMDQNSTQAKLGISIMVLIILPLTVLSYFYMGSTSRAIIELKDAAKIKRIEEEREKFIKKYEKIYKEQVKKELLEDITSQEGIKRRVADAYIEKLINDAKKGIVDKNKPKEKKPKEDKADKDEKEEKESVPIPRQHQL